MKIFRSLPSLCWLLLFLCGLTQVASAADAYRWHLNPRFGTVVLYPSSLLTQSRESDNGDGTRFSSADGRVTFSVFASYNATQRTLKGDLKASRDYWTRKGGRITYWKIDRDWFAVSGYAGQDIFYEKTVLRDGIFHTLTWLYPASQRKRMDTPVSRSVASFKASSFHKSAAVQTAAPEPKAVPSIAPPAPTPKPVAKATPRPAKPVAGY